MNKVAVIVPTSLSHAPYVTYYENILKNCRVPYEIYYWNRFYINEKNEKAKSFFCDSPSHGFWSIRGYAGYRRFLLDEMKNGDYSLYIVLSVQIGILLYQFIKNKKFILDIRDFSHENNYVYSFFSNRLIKSAEAVVISSDGFRSWLSVDREYLLSHNVSFELFKNDNNPPRFDPDRLVLSYIGGVRDYEANICVIKAVSQSHKIFLRYIGSGICEKELEEYCLNKKIENVQFWGRYSPPQKISFYNDTDFVLSCYGNNSEVVRTLTPNRLYESVILGRPIIVNNGTHLADLVQKYEIGIVVNLEKMDDLYENLLAYTNPDKYRNYIENCKKFIGKVQEDVAVFGTTIVDIVKNI